jgi:lysozyme family protein
MALFATAFYWAMSNEDPKHLYAKVEDVGGFAISGINSASYPEQFAKIEAIPQAQRGPAIQQFYQENFWNPWFGQLAQDAISKRVFDAAVNMGPQTAVKLLQHASNTLVTPVINEDGVWGPATVQQANDCSIAPLVDAFITARKDHYADIVKAKPEDEKYLTQWLARASK